MCTDWLYSYWWSGLKYSIKTPIHPLVVSMKGDSGPNMGNWLFQSLQWLAGLAREQNKKKTKQKTLHEELSTVEDHIQTAGTSRLYFPFRVPRRQSSQWRESRAAKHACYGWNVFEFPFNMLCLLNENVVGFHLQNLCLYVHAFHVHTVDWTCSIR